MNIDRSLVARAFIKAGEEPITDGEWEEGTGNRVRAVKDLYLANLLEALASYDWTSQKKRIQLTPIDNYEYEQVLNPVQDDLYKYYYFDDEDNSYHKAEIWDAEQEYYLREKVNLTGYAFMYPLPADCAKVVQLEGNKPYIVEGAFLFSDEADAILLYIRNFFTGKYEFEKVADPVEADFDKYYVKDENGNYEKATGSFSSETTYYVIVENDYNFYDNPVLDPTLSAYFECRLAASIALKLTGGTDKYQMLYNEAQLIANNAQKKSAEQARNRTQGNPWWTQQLGLD